MDSACKFTVAQILDSGRSHVSVQRSIRTFRESRVRCSELVVEVEGFMNYDHGSCQVRASRSGVGMTACWGKRQIGVGRLEQSC